MTIQPFDSGLAADIEGHVLGSPVSIMREYVTAAGRGPRLHRHPYAETFVIHRGRALFTIGAERVVGAGGQILVVPALVSHRFEVLDGGTYEATHIHANDRFVTEWLE